MPVDILEVDKTIVEPLSDNMINNMKFLISNTKRGTVNGTKEERQCKNSTVLPSMWRVIDKRVLPNAS